jgi:murein DD-endopeptidase MepM/ murein hydrolase activator NlpD
MKKYLIFTALFLTFLFFCPKVSLAASETRSIFFPTEKIITFTDDFGDARTGHKHEGNDLIGKKMIPLYSAIDGVVADLEIPEASWGYAITLKDADGYIYNYLHVNNDTPGTDDGKGGVDYAYAPFISVGAKVHKGQLVGWMGDSGNAENVCSHLHFEIRRPDGTAIDPYLSLIAARDGRISAAAMATSQTKTAVAKAVKFVFKNDLSLGDDHQDVKELQKFLNTHGYLIAKSGSGSVGHETTYFGQATKKALIKFQKAKKIYPATGLFGPLTRKAFNK